MPAYRTRDAHPRSLEITTDAPQLEPPSVSIIAPTPRAFTFPINTGPFPPSVASPFSSPSASPFDESRSPITPVSTPPLVRTYTPSSELSSPTSSSVYSPTRGTPASQWRRRKSSGSVVTEPERRPKKGDEDYIKRPENAFILFRRKCVEDRLQAAQEQAESSSTSGEKGKVKKQRQADLSKMISQQWKALTPEERTHWEELAKEKKKEHEALYPHYVYRPQRVKKSEKAKAAASKKGKGAARGEEYEPDLDSMSFILPIPAMPTSARHGRSISAPTPPVAYQTIQLPSISFMPSCPSSPTLGPMPPIRRSSVDRTPRPTDRSYEAAPSQTLMPPMAAPTDYSSTFPGQYQGMYELRPLVFPDQSQHPSMSLPPLTMPASQHSTMQLVSPADSIASGPGSPGPFTPSSNLGVGIMIHGEETNLACGGGQEHDFAFDMAMPDLVYPAWSWEGQALWNPSESLLQTEDFDLHAIPPIELGLPKYDAGDVHEQQIAEQQQQHDNTQPAMPSSSSDCGPQTSTGPWLLSASDARSDGGHDPFAGISFDDMMLSDRF
ncbi:hypothetical protein PUNSTDRAFT_44788 [Punctularia strigosozonata HHB-11173 SS5]|uniref:uncharacterized protein n=1 Tax=Punctularia strigosozonata (strain HHB-11173) TaxID=741275 RepID=UPI0004418644|nr:uncharacterized protein PUNSTDRAFT_44788 [Punctularia strigosozonata HHB-11173 SS5]EIN08224.1 hypothetical protein PUNSTDRAFT_44788 [Punctularia strigosozonata HHB-11173 SS5]